jgi:hypothetical protein
MFTRQRSLPLTVDDAEPAAGMNASACGLEIIPKNRKTRPSCGLRCKKIRRSFHEASRFVLETNMISQFSPSNSIGGRLVERFADKPNLL